MLAILRRFQRERAVNEALEKADDSARLSELAAKFKRNNPKLSDEEARTMAENALETKRFGKPQKGSPLRKAKALPVGTVKDWKGKKFKKTAPGKWTEVREKREERRPVEGHEEALEQFKHGGASERVDEVIMASYELGEPTREEYDSSMKAGRGAYIRARGQGKNDAAATKIAVKAAGDVAEKFAEKAEA